jgi:RNA polymerase sigma-70 factor (ECF subfamily)
MRDAAEYDAFYAGTSRRILGAVFAMTGNLAEAEDAVAEAYARAWQRWDKVREAESPEAWVRTVASRVAVSSWRKAVNRIRAHDRIAGSGQVPDLSPDHVVLVAALRQIPADQRRAIVLHHLVGLTVEEIAHETGSPTGTVKARLARGRRAIAERLSDPRAAPAGRAARHA